MRRMREMRETRYEVERMTGLGGAAVVSGFWRDCRREATEAVDVVVEDRRWVMRS